MAVFFVLGYMLSFSSLSIRLENKLKISTPSERTEFYQKTLEIHKRVDGQVLDNSKIIIGDSLTHGFLTNEFVNFGIASDTTKGVLNRIEDYKSLKKAFKIILFIGINDLGSVDDNQIIENFEKIFEKVPIDKLIVVSLLPVTKQYELGGKKITNERIKKFNKKLQTLCRQKGIKYLDINSQFSDKSGYLIESFELGDGIHLNMSGYKVLSKAFNNL